MHTLSVTNISNRLQLVVEELLTCLQSMGKDGPMNLTVAYEDVTSKREVILRDKVCDGSILESPRMDELSAMIIRNCAEDMSFCIENGYNVLTLSIKE